MLNAEKGQAQNLDGAQLRVGIVQARFNESITNSLTQACREELLALGVQADGQRDVLGLWVEQTEGAKFWLKVFNELKTRGCQDILIAVVDGLKGFPDAIRAVFPEALVQTCIVYLLRHSLDFVSYKDRKLVAGALKDIYRALDAAAGEAALAAFETSEWGRRYPAIPRAGDGPGAR